MDSKTSGRRLSLPVNPYPTDYRDPLPHHPPANFSAIPESGMMKTTTDRPQSSSSSASSFSAAALPYRRRTYSTSDAYSIPEIVIDEVPDEAAQARGAAGLRQIQRLSYKMDHLRIGDIVAEQANEKDRKNAAVITKREELANEQIAQSSPTTRRKSVPNLKSVLEEEPGDE